MAETAARASAWGIPAPAPAGGRCKTVAALALAGPVVVVGAVGFIFWRLAGLAPAALALGVAFLILRTGAASLVDSLAPKPVEDPRLLNIVAGLSEDLAIEAPPVFVVEGEGVNALIFRRGGRTAIGVTEAARRGLTRTELEAVVAHCLVRSDPATGRLDGTSLALGGTFGACAPQVSELDDARAVAITRYPPALAKAIEKATPASGRFAYLWFVAEASSQPSGASRSARLEALASL
jgi:hypothetical protein